MPTNGLYFIHYCLYHLLTLLTTIGVIKANESNPREKYGVILSLQKIGRTAT